MKSIIKLVGLLKLVNKVDSKTRAATQTHKVIIYWYYGYYQKRHKKQGLNSHRGKRESANEIIFRGLRANQSHRQVSKSTISPHKSEVKY
jgi:hypothetical protein